MQTKDKDPVNMDFDIAFLIDFQQLSKTSYVKKKEKRTRQLFIICVLK